MLNILSHEEMQIKTTHSFSNPSQMAIMKKTDLNKTKTNAGLDCRRKGTLTYRYRECKSAQSLCK